MWQEKKKEKKDSNKTKRAIVFVEQRVVSVSQSAMGRICAEVLRQIRPSCQAAVKRYVAYHIAACHELGAVYKLTGERKGRRGRGVRKKKEIEKREEGREKRLGGGGEGEERER